MPPRLAHKKSRRGCQRCKTRKVKCDEIRPECSACTRHGVQCVYGDFQDDTARPFLSQAESASTSSESRVPGLPSPYSEDHDIDAIDSVQGRRRLLELRLLHHYIVKVSTTFPTAHEITTYQIATIYAVEAVEMAFEFPFLLNALFALAALHKALGDSAELPPYRSTASEHWLQESGEIDDMFDYAKAHRIYLNLATRQQREALLDLQPSNADAVCFAAVILSFIALKLIPERLDPTQYTPPLQWLIMANSVATVVNMTLPVLPEDAKIRRVITQSNPNFRDTAAIFNPAHIVPFQALLDHPEPFLSDPETEEAYRLTLALMGGTYKAILDQDPLPTISRRIMSYGPVMPKHFLILLEQRRPRALAILAHMMAMAKYVEKYWWLKGLAEREVYGIRSILPPDWQWALEWPVEMLTKLKQPDENENLSFR